MALGESGGRLVDNPQKKGNLFFMQTKGRSAKKEQSVNKNSAR